MNKLSRSGKKHVESSNITKDKKYGLCCRFIILIDSKHIVFAI